MYNHINWASLAMSIGHGYLFGSSRGWPKELTQVLHGLSRMGVILFALLNRSRGPSLTQAAVCYMIPRWQELKEDKTR